MQRSNPSAESKGLWYSAFPRFSPSAPRYGSPLILTTRSPRQVYNNCHLIKCLIRGYQSKHQMEIMKYHRLIPVQMIRNIEIPPPFLKAETRPPVEPHWVATFPWAPLRTRSDSGRVAFHLVTRPSGNTSSTTWPPAGHQPSTLMNVD